VCAHVECVQMCVYARAYIYIPACVHTPLLRSAHPLAHKVCLFLSWLHTRTVSHVVGEEGRYSFSKTHSTARVVVARGRADVCRYAHANLEKEATTLIAPMAFAEASATLDAGSWRGAEHGKGRGPESSCALSTSIESIYLPVGRTAARASLYSGYASLFSLMARHI
jgi:hypothetical protein